MAVVLLAGIVLRCSTVVQTAVDTELCAVGGGQMADGGGGGSNSSARGDSVGTALTPVSSTEGLNRGMGANVCGPAMS